MFFTEKYRHINNNVLLTSTNSVEYKKKKSNKINFFLNEIANYNYWCEMFKINNKITVSLKY